MCPSAPRVCSEPSGQKPVLSLSMELIPDRDLNTSKIPDVIFAKNHRADSTF